MALLSGRSFSLNPNAPIFIPSALCNVEDFSPEWWKLVKTSRWFQDYWLSQHEEDDFDSIIDDFDSVIDDFDSVVDNPGIAEEFLELVEALFEEIILPTEAGEKPEVVQMPHKNDIEGSEMDAKKVLKDLVIPKSPKKRDPKSPVSPAKYNNKPAKCASPKCSPRFIHQPR